MGYTLVKRYVIDADTRENLVALVEAHVAKSGDEVGLANVKNLSDVELCEIIASATEVGNLNSSCKQFDAWIPDPEKYPEHARDKVNQPTIDMVFEYDRAVMKSIQENLTPDPWGRLNTPTNEPMHDEED